MMGLSTQQQAPAAGHRKPLTKGHVRHNSSDIQFGALLNPAQSLERSRSLPVSPAENSFIKQRSDLVKLGDLGRGACGVVIKALHMHTFRMVAVKDIVIFDKARRSQLMRELYALAQTPMEVPTLITLHAAFYHEGCVSLVLEYMNRGSLQEVQKKHGALSEEVLKHIAFQVTQALEILHRHNIIHRDIKPGNILVNSRGSVKLTDFGVLAALDSHEALAKSYVGTVLYFSPERLDGAYSKPADVWSFGMTLLSLALGRAPFDAEAEVRRFSWAT